MITHVYSWLETEEAEKKRPIGKFRAFTKGSTLILVSPKEQVLQAFNQNKVAAEDTEDEPQKP